MWLINSSIGRKVVMSVTGIALVLFLTFHASMNVVALFSAKGYNMICEFLGANWYAVVGTLGLAALVALHFIFALWLTLQNRKARGNNRYAVTSKPDKVEWASQYMFVLGFIVIIGMCIHLYNYWYNMMAVDLGFSNGNGVLPCDGAGQIANCFKCPCYTIVYLLWLAALWFHLNHGFWSAMQTLGWNGKIWFCRWRWIGCIYTTIVILMFAAVAIAFTAGYRPADQEEAEQEMQCKEMMKKMDAPMCPMMQGCPMQQGCPMEQGCPDCQKGPRPEGGCPDCQKGPRPEGGCPDCQKGPRPEGGCPGCPDGPAPAPAE